MKHTTLFLSGDVMTGRGIDQVLAHPSLPHLYEPYVRSASDYVRLAEDTGVRIHRPVSDSYVWGDALAELERMAPHARIVNLETALTTSEDAAPGKSIHYRMHPANSRCLAAARLACCVLANNHVMDWGERGLLETLDTLHATGIRTAGAGRNEREAVTPAVLEIQSRRVLVFAGAHPSSGVPASWAAGPDRAGVNVISDLSTASAERFARAVRAVRQPGDLVIVSLHIGGNWSYEITLEERAFAHDLVDRAGADIVHGHSSHHVRGIEVYGGKLILYGCGDLLNDYEGIGGHETYRPGLALMYFPVVETETGRLQRLVMTPTSTRAFRICRAGRADAEWLAGLLTHEGERFGTRAVRDADDRLQLCWD